MLAQLTISNFAIVRELEIDFHSGMTVITGEAGANSKVGGGGGRWLEGEGRRRAAAEDGGGVRQQKISAA